MPSLTRAADAPRHRPVGGPSFTLGPAGGARGGRTLRPLPRRPRGHRRHRGAGWTASLRRWRPRHRRRRGLRPRATLARAIRGVAQAQSRRPGRRTGDERQRVASADLPAGSLAEGVLDELGVADAPPRPATSVPGVSSCGLREDSRSVAPRHRRRPTTVGLQGPTVICMTSPTSNHGPKCTRRKPPAKVSMARLA